MKGCPSCGRLYPWDARFCAVDGQLLKTATDAPVVQIEGDARLGQALFERYELRRVVADGATGRVYEGRDLKDRRHVAIKVLHPHVAADSIAVERFRREFEVSRLVSHDYVVEVLDFQPTPDGSHALVMEFLHGEELAATLRRKGVLPPERVVRMLSQVALGLDPAHERRLVHRDLKPENLFLCQTREGDITKVLDFGSVKDRSSSAKQLTMIGTTIGSPFYMAPEQARGLATLDHRADVWALAAICYEALAGCLPFNGPSGPSILAEILMAEAVLPSRAAAGKHFPVPPTVDRVIYRAFRKDPNARYASVGDLADALGVAFGLHGTHRDWACAPEGELGETIREALPELLASPPLEEPSSLEREFFGGARERAIADPFALEATQVATASSIPVPPASRSDQRATRDEELPALPVKRHPWLLLFVTVALFTALVTWLTLT